MVKRPGCSAVLALPSAYLSIFSTRPLALRQLLPTPQQHSGRLSLLGGSYLIFLGIKGLRARANAQPVVASQETASSAVGNTKDRRTGVSMQCIKPQSTHLLCLAVYHRDLGRYISRSSGNLRHLDDGHSTGLVLTCHRSALSTKGGQQASTRRIYY